MSTVYNKVTLNGTTIMDISEDTVEASVLFQNYIAHGADGEEVIGSASSVVYSFEIEPDQTDSTVFVPVGNFNTIFNSLNGLYSSDVYIYPSVSYTVAAYVGNGESGGYIPPMFADDKVFVKWIEYYTYQGSYGNGIESVIVTDVVYGITDENIETYGVVSQKTCTVPLTPQTKSRSYTPTESAQSDTITADEGYSLSSVSVSVGAISSSYVGSGVTRRSSSDLTASGATVTAPSGYYSSNATKTISSGTEGTPTATKGTVSNHSVSVTPSVTNTTGYIAGSTKTGTAVTVSASELVSGTYTVDSSGTKDVTNYASASVPSGTAGTPTASKGTVSNHAVTVTPSVTNSTGWITGSTKTGTGVSVSASELVSGSETKSANGTYDVTNLASLVVAIPFSTITTSSSNPTGGNNGDVWIKTS